MVDKNDRICRGKRAESRATGTYGLPAQYGGKRYFYSINATKMSFFQLRPHPAASSTFNLSSALLSQLAQTTAIFRFHSTPPPPSSGSTANKRSAQWDLAFLRFPSFFFFFFFFPPSLVRSSLLFSLFSFFPPPLCIIPVCRTNWFFFSSNSLRTRTIRKCDLDNIYMCVCVCIKKGKG